ncbi:hypothetical protein [Halobacteriovorax sp. HLS]|uniref:hypothetical protein n=1 Tax=Halobacteriovorax sp. HLS TaxID=2234000 RepID=UPI000FD86E1F|nr:hypothetical protein [Halobacteriovorax sp. HLS]
MDGEDSQIIDHCKDVNVEYFYGEGYTCVDEDQNAIGFTSKYGNVDHRPGFYDMFPLAVLDEGCTTTYELPEKDIAIEWSLD